MATLILSEDVSGLPLREIEARCKSYGLSFDVETQSLLIFEVIIETGEIYDTQPIDHPAREGRRNP